MTRLSRFRSGGGVLLLLLVGLTRCSGDADFSDAVGETVTLPAEAHKAEIMTIDRLVFEEQPVSVPRREALAGHLNALAQTLLDEAKKSKSKFLMLESLEVRHLADISGHLPEKPPPQALQDNWMRLRNNLFDDREWMARSARDLPPTAAMPVSR